MVRGRLRPGRMLGMESGEPAQAAKRDAAYFDQWYEDMATSPARDAIVARTLGLPPELQSNSMLTWQGIAEVTEALRMPPDGLLLDVACGRGGYGIEGARGAGDRLRRGGVPEGLRRPPEGLLLEVAWGRGGYGTGVAGRAGARLLGVDFSVVALGQA